MGYETYITGDGVITPQIPDHLWPQEYRDPGNTYNDTYFVFKQQDGDEDVQVVNGQITVVGKTAGVTLVDWYPDERAKFYDFDGNLQGLVDFVKSQGASITATFYGDGEDSDDFWRAHVDNNVIATERGEITYPSERYEVLKGKARDARNHGHVVPRADGVRTVCGGTLTCSECQADARWLGKLAGL